VPQALGLDLLTWLAGFWWRQIQPQANPDLWASIPKEVRLHARRHQPGNTIFAPAQLHPLRPGACCALQMSAAIAVAARPF
jgi:hypothetical protein